jgi:hypothetical protein
MPRHLIRRWFVGVLVTLVAIEAVYLIGANSFLRSEWGHDLMNRRPDKLSVAWDSAWTWLPGLVSFRQLELRGQARRASWQTTIDSGHMVIWLPSLLRKHFRLLDGSGSGGEVEVDTRPPSEDAKAPRMPRRGWRVTLDSLAIEPLQIVRVNEHRLTGAGRVRGLARFQVRGPMELDLDEIIYAAARLDTGEEVAADSVELNGRIHVAPFVVGDDAVGDILAGTTGDLEIDAEASGLGFLSAYLGSVPWLELGGRGHLKIDLEVTDGWLAPGSRLDLVGPTVTAKYFDLEARGEGTLQGSVPEGAGHTEINVLLSRFSVVRPEDEARLLQGQNLDVRIRNDSTAIDRPAEGITLDVDLPEAQIPDFSSFSQYLPEASGLELTGGQGQITAELTYSAFERSGSGAVHLSGDRVEAVFGDVRLRSKVQLEGTLAEMRLDDGSLDIAGSRLLIEDTEVSAGGRVRGRGWWGRIELEEGTWTNVPEAAETASGILEGLVLAELRDTGPLVALLEKYVRKLAWFDGLLTVHDVTATTRARSQGSSLRLRGLEVTGGEKQRLEILGELDLEEKSPSGVFYARWGPLTAAVALEEGERDWKLTRSRRWYDSQVDSYRGEATGSASEIREGSGSR